MMKPGIKLLFIALSCLTLASGCTKKKSNNSSKAPVKAETKTDPATGPVKTDPAPTVTPPAGDPDKDSPSARTPAPATDPTKTTPAPSTTASTPTPTPSTSTGGATVTPQATVTQPKVEPKASTKSDIEIYEECVVPAVASLLTIEREKNAESIEAKKLFETKLEVLKKCQKPASLSADVADTLVTKKIMDFAEVKFIDAEGNVDAFYEIERQRVPEAERRKIYEQISIEMKAAAAQANARTTTPTPPAAVTQPAPVQQPAVTATPSATPAPTPTPTIATPAPIVPQKAAVQPTPPATRSVAPAAPAQQKAEPVKAAAVPATKDTKKDTQLVTDFKKCFGDFVSPGIAAFKANKADVISPRDLYEIKLAALSVCDAESTKEPTLDEYMTNFIVTAVNKDFPKSATTVKMFVDTEKQKLAIEAKRAVYDRLAKEAKVESKFAKPAVNNATAKANANKETGKEAKTNEPQKPAVPVTEVKDIAALESCLSTKIDTLVAAEKKKKADLESPIQIFALEKTVIPQCKIAESADVVAARSNVLQQKALAHYPKDKEKIDYYIAVSKMTTNDQLKLKLFHLYNFYLEIQEKNSVVTGTLDPAQTSGNMITYAVKTIGGESLVKIQPPGKKLATQKGESDNIQPQGLFYIFDFTLKENKMPTMTVKLENHLVISLDFTLAQGTLADLKEKKPVVIALTAESWKKVWELRWRQQLQITQQEAAKFPLKFNIESAKGTLPLCELKATELACSDPDLSTKMKVNLNGLNP